MEKFVISGTDVQYPKPGEIFEIDGLRLTVLFPDSLFSTKVSNINNASIVIRIDHQDNSFLFTGDAETRAENLYSKLGDYLNVEVVKVGHHGSKTSSSLSIVEHPSASIMERWQKSGTQLFRTDEYGAITMESNGESLHLSKMIE
jgi:competence protein ComEC